MFTVARAFQQLGYLTEAEGRPHEALELARHGLETMRSTGNRVGTSRTLYTVARLHWGLGQAAEARSAYDESLALSEQAADQLGIRGAYEGLGNLAYEAGDCAEGRACFEIVLDVTERMRQPAAFQVRQLVDIAEVAARHADPEAARPWFARASTIAQGVRDPDLLAELQAKEQLL